MSLDIFDDDIYTLIYVCATIIKWHIEVEPTVGLPTP